MLTGSGDSATPVVTESADKLVEQQSTLEKEAAAAQTAVVSELKNE